MKKDRQIAYVGDAIFASAALACTVFAVYAEMHTTAVFTGIAFALSYLFSQSND